MAIQWRLSGDLPKADALRREALIFFNQNRETMKFNSLGQSKKCIDLPGGASIVISSAFNTDIISIYVPPEEEEVVVEEEEGLPPSQYLVFYRVGADPLGDTNGTTMVRKMDLDNTGVFSLGSPHVTTDIGFPAPLDSSSYPTQTMAWKTKFGFYIYAIRGCSLNTQYLSGGMTQQPDYEVYFYLFYPDHADLGFIPFPSAIQQWDWNFPPFNVNANFIYVADQTSNQILVLNYSTVGVTLNKAVDIPSGTCYFISADGFGYYWTTDYSAPTRVAQESGPIKFLLEAISESAPYQMTLYGTRPQTIDVINLDTEATVNLYTEKISNASAGSWTMPYCSVDHGAQYVTPGGDSFTESLTASWASHFKPFIVSINDDGPQVKFEDVTEAVSITQDCTFDDVGNLGVTITGSIAEDISAIYTSSILGNSAVSLTNNNAIDYKGDAPEHFYFDNYATDQSYDTRILTVKNFPFTQHDTSPFYKAYRRLIESHASGSIRWAPLGNLQAGGDRVCTKSDITQMALVTPFEVMSVTNSEFGSIEGWMHVDNPDGLLLLQGLMSTDYTNPSDITLPIIYCNGKRFDSDLASALGVERRNILAIMLYPQFNADPGISIFA